MSLSKFPRVSDNENLRSAFKDNLTKLMAINTREQATKELKALIMQNKTTINLRIWLSVLAENRNRHSQSEINIFSYMVQQYGKGLLDPLDKIPSLQRTVFRITELLVKLFFKDESQNVSLALQRVWMDLYVSSLFTEEVQVKKKLLYNNLQAILNGGADKLSQITGQFVLQGLLQTALNKQDLIFFKEIAKRSLVLFLKITVIHSSVLTCLQTVLGYFNINNLIPLLENIINKIFSYVSIAPVNSNGYKMKSQACNALCLIGEQIDQNGVNVQQKVIRLLQDLATDKVWAVQVSGRKAVAVWKKKKKQWQNQFNAKNEQVFNYASNSEVFQEPPQEEKSFKWAKPRPVTADNFRPKEPVEQESFKQNTQYKFPDYTQGRYLHKNTGIGGGNTVQSVQQYFQRQKPQETYIKKMQQIKKSIYQPKEQYTQYDETIRWQQGKNLPAVQPSKVKQPSNFIPSKISNQPYANSQFEYEQDHQYLQKWQTIIDLFEKGKKEESVKAALQLQDDIYFLRFMLKYGKGLLKDLTRATANKVIKQMLQIKKTNFMEQLFFKMVAQSAKTGSGALLTNQQNLEIVQKLEQCKKIQALHRVANKLQVNYEKSLQ